MDCNNLNRIGTRLVNNRTGTEWVKSGHGPLPFGTWTKTKVGPCAKPSKRGVGYSTVQFNPYRPRNLLKFSEVL